MKNIDSILKDSLNKWNDSNGNYTYSLLHPLNSDSIVVELGGYDGTWVSRMIPKYNCNYYVLEPIKSFYEKIVQRFESNEKIKVLNFGLSTENKESIIYLNGDETTLHKKIGEEEKIKLCTLEYLLESIGENYIDLIQINIEGEEYTLLEYLINNDILNKVKRMQIQFHTFVENCESRRLKIQEGLSKRGFKKIYDFPFVFECWEKILK